MISTPLVGIRCRIKGILGAKYDHFLETSPLCTILQRGTTSRTPQFLLMLAAERVKTRSALQLSLLQVCKYYLSSSPRRQFYIVTMSYLDIKYIERKLLLNPKRQCSQNFDTVL
jgi:hypothetical protein